MLERASDREQARSQMVNQSLAALNTYTEASQAMAAEALARVNEVREAVANAGPAGPRRPPKIDQNTFPRLKLSPGQDEANAEAFRNWETSVRSRIEANGLQWPQTGTGIIGILNEGGAGKYIANLYKRLHHAEHRPDGDIRNLDQLLETLRRKIVGHCYREKARARFDSKVQGDHEDLISYHGDFERLHGDAFEEPAAQQAVLIDHFIAGIRNKEIMKHLIRHRPANYADALTQAMEQEGYVERFQLNQARIKNGGHLPKSYGAGPKGRPANRGGVEAMEVDNMNVNRRGGNNFRGRNQNNRNNRNGQPGGSRTDPPGQSKPRDDKNSPGKKKKLLCFNCDSPAHLAKACPAPKRRKRVNNLNPGHRESQEEVPNGGAGGEKSGDSEFEEYESDDGSESLN